MAWANVQAPCTRAVTVASGVFLIASCAVSALHRIARAATVLLFCACAQPTDVELRLHACALAGAVPVRVDLEIRGLDAEGASLPVLKDSYEIDAAALADGYATVGLRKPAGMVGADFIVTWHDGRGGVEVVELLDRPVPAAGEVLELDADRCTSPGSGTSSSSGDATTSGTSSTGTVDDTSTSTDTDTTSGTTGGTTTGDTTTGDTTTSDTTSSSTGDTDGTSGTTGEQTIVGTPCTVDEDGLFYCEGGGPGQIGTMLTCSGQQWEVGDLKMICDTLIGTNCPPSLGMTNPYAVGCNGEGADGLTCVWKDMPGQMCEMTGCVDGKTISLCDGGDRVLAVCSGDCVDFEGLPQCVEML